MNKRGFTTVELIVSFGLVTVISIFLFQLLFSLKDIFIDSGIKTKLLNKQAVISERMEEDFKSKKLLVASNCGVNCTEFIFDDGTIKKLSYDRDESTIKYGEFKDKLIDGSNFGNIEISNEIVTANYTEDNGILRIKIPVFNKFFDNEDFGINLVYQYNSLTTSINSIDINDDIASAYDIYLIGNSKDVKFQNVDYEDPGYYLYDVNTNEVVTNSSLVTVTGTVGDKLGESYSIEYNYKNSDIGLDVTKTRIVTVVSDVYDYKFSGKSEIFIAPVDGNYKLEAWGASGGGSSSLKGHGGYSKGEIELVKGDRLIITVGGEGYVSSDDNQALGGFNGGGESGGSTINKAGSGGGASDIRLLDNKLDSRILVAGGGGGGGSRMDSSFKCNGGAGGGTKGLIGTCSADSYLGQGGTSSEGGAAATYSTSMYVIPTAGSFGVGGNGGSYGYDHTYSSGGGGGGYYGGGGGSRYGGGGGGSGICMMDNCILKDGATLFDSPTTGSEKGHVGNGNIKVSLVSIIAST